MPNTLQVSAKANGSTIARTSPRASTTEPPAMRPLTRRSSTFSSTSSSASGKSSPPTSPSSPSRSRAQTPLQRPLFDPPFLLRPCREGHRSDYLYCSAVYNQKLGLWCCGQCDQGFPTIDEAGEKSDA